MKPELATALLLTSTLLASPNLLSWMSFDQAQQNEEAVVYLQNSESDPDSEATQVAETIESLRMASDAPLLAVFEPRILEDPGPAAVEAVATASFPVPDECTSSTAEATLLCSTGLVHLSPTVINNDGEFLPVEVAADSEEISLSIPITANLSYPVVFTIYLADPEAKELLETAEEALAWMIAEDEVPAGSEDEINSEEELNAHFEGESLSRMFADEGATQGHGAAVNARAVLVGSFKAVPTSASRPKKVNIPSSYRYCPNTCTPKARHDYCASPAANFWATSKGAADFRGPCARHDMMIANIAKKSISLSSKKTQRYQGDLQFRANLQQNCRHGFYKLSQTGSKASCFAVSGTYYAAVTYTTSQWNGK